MILSSDLSAKIKDNSYDSLLSDIYIDSSKISYEKNRYCEALECYEAKFGASDVAVFSAPGRTEIGGNHTDHQHGEVLAASVNFDVIAVAAPIEKSNVTILSEGCNPITISLAELGFRREEAGTTKALIRGMLFRLKENGHKIGGFNAYITSDVPCGSGLSSSAAFETIVGVIISGLYNNMEISAVEIAMAGQYAESQYFMKPCGLMDQMACSVGSLCYMDFNDPSNPVIEKIDFNLEQEGYSLCITDTKGSHADLTDDYATVPKEMKEVAKFFDKAVLRDVSWDDFTANIPELRKKFGDRAVLRSLHFFEETKRAKAEANALKNGKFDEFLKYYKSSGDSSFKYLQNVYTDHDSKHQNVSIALAFSEVSLGDNGICRVHGGGFAGTIQAFVKTNYTGEYKKQMDSIFGEDSCKIFKIRKYGGMKVMD